MLLQPVIPLTGSDRRADRERGRGQRNHGGPHLVRVTGGLHPSADYLFRQLGHVGLRPGGKFELLAVQLGLEGTLSFGMSVRHRQNRCRQCLWFTALRVDQEKFLLNTHAPHSRALSSAD